VVGRGLDVALAQGEVLALLGPNGGGKTTLLKTLLGILKPQAGEVAIGDRSLAAISLRERARLIAYVPQVHVPTFARQRLPAECVGWAIRAFTPVFDGLWAPAEASMRGTVLRAVPTRVAPLRSASRVGTALRCA